LGISAGAALATAGVAVVGTSVAVVAAGSSSNDDDVVIPCVSTDPNCATSSGSSSTGSN
jgi:hypothetical protein